MHVYTAFSVCTYDTSIFTYHASICTYNASICRKATVAVTLVTMLDLEC